MFQILLDLEALFPTYIEEYMERRTDSTLHDTHPFTGVLPSLRDLMNCNSFLSPASAWSRELCQAARGSDYGKGGRYRVECLGYDSHRKGH